MQQRVIVGAVGGLALLVGLAGGYGIGSATASPSALAVPPSAIAPPRAGTGPRHQLGRGIGRGVVGTVAALDHGTVQVRTASGQTAVVVGSSTVINETLRTTAASVRVGECIRAVGPSGPTGEVTARSVLVSAPGPSGCSARTGRRAGRTGSG